MHANDVCVEILQQPLRRRRLQFVVLAHGPADDQDVQRGHLSSRARDEGIVGEIKRQDLRTGFDKLCRRCAAHSRKDRGVFSREQLVHECEAYTSRGADN